MLVADDDRRYVAANQAACLLLRLPEHQVLTFRHDDLVAPERHAQMRERWAQYLARGSLTGQSDLLLPDGTLLAIDFAGVANVAPHRHLSVFLPAGWDRAAVTMAAAAPAVGLTRREQRILELVALGVPVERIAADMDLSPHTVRTHIRNARVKLGANSRAHAIGLAFRAGLLGPVG
jgi:DNA-binding CsgD family transcriptional regulator